MSKKDDKTVEVLVIEPTGDCRIENIDSDKRLGELQRIVGGYIEYVPNGRGLTLYCNEEGKIKGLDPNMVGTKFADFIEEDGDYIAGPLAVLGAPDDEGYEIATLPTNLGDKSLKDAITDMGGRFA